MSYGQGDKTESVLNPGLGAGPANQEANEGAAMGATPGQFAAGAAGGAAPVNATTQDTKTTVNLRGEYQ